MQLQQQLLSLREKSDSITVQELLSAMPLMPLGTGVPLSGLDYASLVGFYLWGAWRPLSVHCPAIPLVALGTPSSVSSTCTEGILLRRVHSRTCIYFTSLVCGTRYTHCFRVFSLSTRVLSLHCFFLPRSRSPVPVVLFLFFSRVLLSVSLSHESHECCSHHFPRGFSHRLALPSWHLR
jgi:hypothetical protein